MSRNGGGFRGLFRQPKPLIAVCHLPPLPDYPGSPGIDAIRAHALADLALLEQAGFDGILLENEHDRPHRVTAEPATVEAMHHVTAEAAMMARNVMVGCEILLNDQSAARAIDDADAVLATGQGVGVDDVAGLVRQRCVQ